MSTFSQKDMIEKKTLLQINATIITGLLILLTIQATTEGGIPFLLELGSLRNSVEMYDEAMNDTSIDPILLKAMKERQAELKLEVMEQESRLKFVPDFWLIQLIFNPISTFTFSMMFFIFSTIMELYNKGEAATKSGLAITYAGFLIMFIAVLLMIIMPAG